MTCRRERLVKGLTEPERAIANGCLRRDDQAAGLQIDEQLLALRGLLKLTLAPLPGTSTPRSSTAAGKFGSPERPSGWRAVVPMCLAVDGAK